MAKLDAKRRGGQRSRVSIDVVFLGFDDSSFVTGIGLFGDDGIAHV